MAPKTTITKPHSIDLTLAEVEAQLAKVDQRYKTLEERYTALLDHLPDAVHVWKLIRSNAGDILTWELLEVNRAALAFFEKSKDQIIGKTSEELFGVQDTKDFMPVVQEIFQTGKPYQKVEHLESSNRFLTVTACPIKDCFIAIRRDITIELLLQQPLDEKTELLNQSEKLSQQGSWKWDIIKDEWSFSENWLRIHGFDQTKIEKDELMTLAHPDDVNIINESFDHALRGITPYDIAHRIIRKDNQQIRWIQAVGSVIHGTDGKPIKMIGIAKDITEKRAAAKEMRKSEDFLSRTGEIARVGGWQLEGDFSKVYQTKTTRDLHEIPEDYELTTEEAINFYHPDDREMVANCVSEAIETGKPFSFEARFITAKNNQIWVQAKGEPQMVDGTCVKLSGVFQDISERKKSEQALERINKNLEKLVEKRAKKAIALSKELEVYWLAAEHAKTGVWRYDVRNNTLQWDTIMFELYGVDEEDFSGAYEAWESILHPDDVEESVKILEASIDEKKDLDITFRIIQPNTGEIRYLKGKGKVELDDQGNTKGLFGTNYDITYEMSLVDQKEMAYRRLQETQSQLIHSEKMATLGILTAGVAHELNNPLNFIQGGYKSIRKSLEENGEISKEELSKFLSWISIGAERATDIVKSLNAFTRTNEEKVEPYELHTIINDCLLMLQNKYRDRIRIDRDFDKESVTLIGNTGKIHQVVLNLLSNAVDAIADAGTIKIKTRLKSNEVILVIADNGCGIAKKDLRRIADPFYTTKPVGKGTGLGLSITNVIIKEHKGDISFSSTLHKGTTVEVRFPR